MGTSASTTGSGRRRRAPRARAPVPSSRALPRLVVTLVTSERVPELHERDARLDVRVGHLQARVRELGFGVRHFDQRSAARPVELATYAVALFGCGEPVVRDADRDASLF